MNTVAATHDAIDNKLAWLRERAARAQQSAGADANPLISTSVEVAPISPAPITQSPPIPSAPAATFTPKTPYPAPTFEPTPAAINVVTSAPAQGEAVDIPSAKKHSTKEASYVALGQLGLMGIKTSADDVYLVIASAIRAGAVDVTRREVQVLFERRFERRMDANLISARVNELVTAGKVLERKEDRICTVTGNKVGALYVVMKQTRMVW